MKRHRELLLWFAAGAAVGAVAWTAPAARACEEITHYHTAVLDSVEGPGEGNGPFPTSGKIVAKPDGGEFLMSSASFSLFDNSDPIFSFEAR